MMYEDEARELWKALTHTQRAALMDFAAWADGEYYVCPEALRLNGHGLITFTALRETCGQTTAILNLTPRGDALVTAVETLGLRI